MSTNARSSARSGEQSSDLRARRTRKWLQDALIALMREKPFQQIQITELCRRAQVSRPAFYLHFRSKEELLLSHVDSIFDAFHAHIVREIRQGTIDRKRFSIMLFEYWERDAETLRMVLQADNPEILIERLREHFGTVLSELPSSVHKPLRDPRLSNLAVGFAAGGAYMLLREWLAQQVPLPSEHMGLLMYELMKQC